eukprot:m.225187 g.225187  ORF g.225187 m.225187 type:complete len:233 (+) comp11226_c0_seq1:3-701(+)
MAPFSNSEMDQPARSTEEQVQAILALARRNMKAKVARLAGSASRVLTWELTRPLLRTIAGLLLFQLYPHTCLIAALLCSVLIYIAGLSKREAAAPLENSLLNVQRHAANAYPLFERITRSFDDIVGKWFATVQIDVQAALTIIGYDLVRAADGEGVSVKIFGKIPFLSFFVCGTLARMAYALGMLLAIKLSVDLTLRNILQHFRSEAAEAAPTVAPQSGTQPAPTTAPSASE